MARATPTKSSASSDTTRAAQRRVSTRRRNDRAGGRLRRTSERGRAVGSEPLPSRASASAPGSAADEDESRMSLVALGINLAPPRKRSVGMQVALFAWQSAWRATTGLVDAPADQPLEPGLLDGASQPLAQLHLRFPSEDLAGQRDVGLADLRIVGGQRLVDDLRP